MTELQSIGKLLIVVGGFLAVAGLLLLLAGRIWPLGRLPGDLVFRSEHLTVYLPLATMLLLSLILTLLINLGGRR